MLTLSDCSSNELSNAFDAGRFRLHLGSLVLKVSSNIPEFIAIFRQLYGDHPVSLGGGEYDFDLAIRPHHCGAAGFDAVRPLSSAGMLPSFLWMLGMRMPCLNGA